MALQFRRGTAADRLASTEAPAVGEPWFTYDDGQLYIGDGVTVGGVNVGSNVPISQLNDVTLISESVRAISSYSITSNVVSIALSLNHNYYEGLSVEIANSPVSILNGTHLITGIFSGNGFTFDLTAADVSSTTTTGTVTPLVEDGYTLVWDATANIWKEGLPTLSLDSLTDVDTTTVVPIEDDILIYDGTALKFKPIAFKLGNISDVNGAYLSTATPTYSSPNIGNSLRLDFDGKWTPYRPGEAITDGAVTDYIETTFLPNYDSISGPNASLWTKTADLADVNPGTTYPQPPYGSSLLEGLLYFSPDTPPSAGLTDLTFDFWAYRNSTSSSYPLTPVKVWSSGPLLLEIGYSVGYLYVKSAAYSNVYAGTARVRYWNFSGTDIASSWNHFRICRQGGVWRAWFNGASLGSGLTDTATKSATWNFDWETTSTVRFGDSKETGQTLDDLTGPVYLDFRRAISDVTSATIEVPTSAVGEFVNNTGSGIYLGEINDVDLETDPPTNNQALVYNTARSKWIAGDVVASVALDDITDVDLQTTPPADGDTLIYDSASSTWIPGASSGSGTAILSTSFRYRLATAPTSVVASSDMLGKNLGQMLEVTFANKATLGEGPPSAAFDPSLTGVTFDSALGQFSNIPQGVYVVNATATIRINNVVPSFVTTPPMVYFEVIGYSTGSLCFFGTSNYLTPVLPYASYGSALSSLVYSGSFTWTAVDTNPLTNFLEIYLDQDQGPTYYVERASIDLTRIADA